MNERILLAGEPKTSKTTTAVRLALSEPDATVFVIDPDNSGYDKVVEENGGWDLLSNLIYNFTPNWADIEAAVSEGIEVLGTGDWMVLEMLGRYWDKAQDYFSEKVYGEDPLEHLLALRAMVPKEAATKEKQKSVAFKGFEGTADWPLIKRIHSERALDKVVVNQTVFNVLATTSLKQIDERELQKAEKFISMWKQIGMRPEGEKHNLYRFDTIVYMRKTVDDRYVAKVLDDRGRPTVEFDVTDSSFWEEYKKEHNL